MTTVLTTTIRRYAALLGDAVAFLSLLLIVGGVTLFLGALS